MTESKENIFLFVPNIIGFGRVILAIISFYFMPTHCVLASVCYVTSALLDAIDGHAARYFNQSLICFENANSFALLQARKQNNNLSEAEAFRKDPSEMIAETSSQIKTRRQFSDQEDTNSLESVVLAIDTGVKRFLSGQAKPDIVDTIAKSLVNFAKSSADPLYRSKGLEYNISTKFGAILDQLTDRAGTACLMMTLATFYPEYTFWFQISMAIDITCHWLYLHTVTLQGKASHKFIDMSENPIMRIYYTNKMVLFSMCAGNEAFYAALYVMYFYSGPTVLGVGLYKLIAIISAPVAIVKAGISVLQGIVGAINLSTIDINERIALAEKQKN